MFQKLFSEYLENVSYGLPLDLTVVHCDGQVQRIGRTAPGIPDAVLTFRHRSAYRRVLLDPSLGFGECYAEGKLDVQGTRGLYHLLRAFYGVLEKMPRLIKPLQALLRYGSNFGAYNDPDKCRDDAQAHYDANDEIVRIITGREHVYSCALFLRPYMTLDQAQETKIEYLLQKALCGPGMSLLDIGCGYGALMRRAAKKHGMLAYGTTLSQNQQRIAQGMITHDGLEKSCHIADCDYRAVECRYDRIISVGMFEHVGRRCWPDFFRTVARALAPDGIFVLHTVCLDRRAPRDRFILKHVFPGYELPTFTDVIGKAARAGFRLRHCENLQSHYAKTLLCWLENLRENHERIAQAYGEYRYRLFEVYLAGTAASFSVPDGMQLGQFVFTTKRRDWPANPLYFAEWIPANISPKA